MKYANRKFILGAACVLLGSFSLTVSAATEVEELTALLHEFLGAAHTQAAHRTFWAEDLIYTSSNGTRFGKSEILAGFEGAEPEEEGPAVVYSAADLDVRVFGDTAIIAFRLIGTPADGSPVLNYFNTGTALRRGGSWQVLAWQATTIPGPGKGTD